MSDKGPAPWPCASCPYRKDVPSGVWSDEEYDKLPRYDLPTADQPPSVFTCHQGNGRLCSGWVGCHDMLESMGMRMSILHGTLSRADYEAALDYSSPVELFESGEAAAEHGRAEIEIPGAGARRTIDKLDARRRRRGGPNA